MAARRRADRPLPLRGGRLRHRGTADLCRVLPLHPLPAANRNGGVGQRADGGRVAEGDRARGSGARLHARGRKALLLGVRFGAVQSQPRCSGPDGGAPGGPGSRSRRPARLAPVRSRRCAVGVDPRRRTPPLSGAPTRLISPARTRPSSPPRTRRRQVMPGLHERQPCSPARLELAGGQRLPGGGESFGALASDRA